LCAYLLSIDASLAEGFVEEEFYEDEEENFDQYTTQGKLSCKFPLQVFLLVSYYPCFTHACFAKFYCCLEKLIGLGQSWFSSVSQEYQAQPSLVELAVIMIPSYAKNSDHSRWEHL